MAHAGSWRKMMNKVNETSSLVKFAGQNTLADAELDAVTGGSTKIRYNEYQIKKTTDRASL
jgi:hypothetical protein